MSEEWVMENIKISEESKTIYELEGLLKGISSDGLIENDEIVVLEKWLNSHKNLKDICPFSDLYEIIEKSKNTKFLEQDVKAELLQFCNEFDSPSGALDRLSHEIGVLKGFIQGIMADNVIEVDELVQLEQWLIARQDLIDKWPFRELSALITSVLEDNEISKEEHEEMMKFFNSFLSEVKSNAVNISGNLADTSSSSIDMLYSADNISIQSQTFCLAGIFSKKNRKDYIFEIYKSGGNSKTNVDASINFLVIGSGSYPNWTFATYGGKVESVLKLNSGGTADIKIISEDTLHAALK